MKKAETSKKLLDATEKELIGNQDQRITDLETKESEMAEINSLRERVERLENVIEYNEYRSRKYNVLLYGIKQDENEDVCKVVTGFLTNELKISKEEVESMIICNAHRIPRHQSTLSGEDDSNPDAIIVKFGRMSDRNRVLFSRVKLKGKSVRSDLPTRLKKKRAELSRVAYNLRQREKWMTAIRESRHDVWLEVKKNKTESWSKYND